MHKTIVAAIGMKRARYLMAATTCVAGLSGQRRTFMLKASRIAATIVALALPLVAANAQSAGTAPVTELTIRTGNDLIQWGQLNISPLTIFPTPVKFESYGGVDGTIEAGQRGTAMLNQQCCPGNGNYYGNFAPADILLQPNANTVTLDFKTPLILAGTQFGGGNDGPFTVTVQAYSHNKLLGTFPENGNTTSNGDNSAIFLGVQAPTAEITRVVYTFSGQAFRGYFAINEVSLEQ